MAMGKVMDFRSDTTTRPTPEMMAAIAGAQVGDDVFKDDPTVNELQETAAALLGTESALYVASGTMGNLVAILTHCVPGDCALVGTMSHIWLNEGGGIASLAGVMPTPLDDSRGIPDVAEVRAKAVRDNNVHHPWPSLLCLENTHNFSGGTAIDPETFAAVTKVGRELGLKVHLDGARLFNACALFGVDPKRYAASVDTVQICLSKGLGAPMGSLLCGPTAFVDRARFWRKRLGGGQRQVGISAAAGLVALKTMRDRLAEDHENANLLARLLAEAGFEVERVPNSTNMVFFKLGGKFADSPTLEARCRAKGLLLHGNTVTRMRMVTHYNVNADDVRAAVEIIRQEAAK